jgi:hypothetical protein
VITWRGFIRSFDEPRKSQQVPGATPGGRTSRLAGIVAAVAFGVLGIYLIAQRFVPALPGIWTQMGGGNGARHERASRVENGWAGPSLIPEEHIAERAEQAAVIVTTNLPFSGPK